MVGLGRVGRYKGGVLARTCQDRYKGGLLTVEVGRSLHKNRCIFTQSLLHIGRVCGMGGLVRTN